MIASPFAVALTATIAEFWPRVTLLTVAAVGVAAATNELVAADAALSPNALVATTLQVYVLPLVSELTTIGDEAPVFDCVVPPSLDVHVIVCVVIARPPLEPSVNVTLAELSPRVATPMVGAAGAVAATNELVAADAALSLNAVVATTLQV